MVLLHFMILSGCTTDTARPAAPPPPHWQLRTDAELESVLDETCRSSLASGEPILIEFSAPWCVDCKKLEHLEDEQALAGEYTHWQRVRIDVGRFDRHAALREAFAVSSIAHWAAVRPITCDARAPSWPRLREGVMEVETSQTGPRTAADLVAWLRAARGG